MPSSCATLQSSRTAPWRPILLEPRLYPLLETLTRAGLDWLAQEIVSGALAGTVKEEAPETLQAARRIVFRRYQESASLVQVKFFEERAEAFSGEEQIDWAAQHVAQRLEEVLEMFRNSIDRLDELTQRQRPEELLSHRGAKIVLVLTDGDAVETIDRAQVTAAIKGVGELKDALNAWVAEARRGEQL